MCSLNPCEPVPLKPTSGYSLSWAAGGEPGLGMDLAKQNIGEEHAARPAAHPRKAVPRSTVTADSRPSLPPSTVRIRGLPLPGTLLLQQMSGSWSSSLKIQLLVTFVPQRTRPVDLTYCSPNRQNSAVGCQQTACISYSFKKSTVLTGNINHPVSSQWWLK